MRHEHWILGLAVLALAAGGCGKSGGTAQSAGTPAEAASQTDGEAAPTATPAQPEGPAAVVAQFLEAYRTGDDEKAVPLLSSIARQKMAEANLNVTPSKSDTARFEVGAIEYIKPDGATTPEIPPDCTGARVDCKWIDLDETGKAQADRVVWVVRKEENKWGVVGMAAYVFENEPPLLLTYEDPQDMQKKQQWLREEMARREQQASSEAQVGKNSKESIRR